MSEKLFFITVLEKQNERIAELMQKMRDMYKEITHVHMGNKRVIDRLKQEGEDG